MPPAWSSSATNGASAWVCSKHTRTVQIDGGEDVFKKLFMIIIYVHVESQYPFPCCLKKMFIAFIFQFHLAASIYCPINDE